MIKLILAIFFLSMMEYSLAASLSKNFIVTRIKYNSEKQYYDVDFLNQAGIYNSEEKHFKCLQRSLQSKKEVKIRFNPMGLKVESCQN